MGAQTRAISLIAAITTGAIALGSQELGGDSIAKFSPYLGCRDTTISENYFSGSITVNDSANEINTDNRNPLRALNKAANWGLNKLNSAGGHYYTEEVFADYSTLIDELEPLGKISFDVNVSNNLYPTGISETCRDLKKNNRELRGLQSLLDPQVEMTPEEINSATNLASTLRQNYEKIKQIDEGNTNTYFLNPSLLFYSLTGLFLAGTFWPSRKRKK